MLGNIFVLEFTETPDGCIKTLHSSSSVRWCAYKVQGWHHAACMNSCSVWPPQNQYVAIAENSLFAGGGGVKSANKFEAFQEKFQAEIVLLPFLVFTNRRNIWINLDRIKFCIWRFRNIRLLHPLLLAEVCYTWPAKKKSSGEIQKNMTFKYKITWRSKQLAHLTHSLGLWGS